MIAKCIMALRYVDAFSFGGRVEQWAKDQGLRQKCHKGLEKSKANGPLENIGGAGHRESYYVKDEAPIKIRLQLQQSIFNRSTGRAYSSFRAVYIFFVN